MVLNVIPDFARPFLAWFVTIPNRKHYNAAAKFLKPIVEQRMVDIANARQDPDSKYQEPDDFISWSIHAAENAPDPKERTVVMLSRRFMTMNFVAIHTTAVTSANALLDIFSTRPEQRVVETLREEAARVYNEEGQRWTKNGLARMHHMDSAIRESMRMHNFIIWGAQRKVMAKGGVIAPNGLHLPEGSSISVQAFAAHRSPEMYKNPDVFDPFRFSRLRETEEKESQSAHIKGITAATTSDHFMHFGHGRYACPGRFFAIQEVKLLLAYLIINYEVKLYATRPPNSWLGDIILPPAKATMMVRRKATPLAV
jgi:cytochrome P450